jgi:L-rhamnose mutarotase
MQQTTITDNKPGSTEASFSTRGEGKGLPAEASAQAGLRRIAFKMQLLPGFEEEYRKRHDEIWPDLHEWLKENKISDYSIFLDKTTLSLFAILHIPEGENLDRVPHHPVMKKWWDFMKDIMETNPDNSPVSVPLEEVFYLP